MSGHNYRWDSNLKEIMPTRRSRLRPFGAHYEIYLPDRPTKFATSNDFVSGDTIVDLDMTGWAPARDRLDHLIHNEKREPVETPKEDCGHEQLIRDLRFTIYNLLRDSPAVTVADEMEFEAWLKLCGGQPLDKAWPEPEDSDSDLAQKLRNDEAFLDELTRSVTRRLYAHAEFLERLADVVAPKAAERSHLINKVTNMVQNRLLGSNEFSEAVTAKPLGQLRRLLGGK